MGMRILQVHVERRRIGGADPAKPSLTAPEFHAALEVRIENPHVCLTPKGSGQSQLSPRDYLDAIYEEIESQYHKDPERNKLRIWIAYVEEGIARLEDNGLTIPIGDKISLLAYEYHEKLWKD
jgi:hypothetical protein